MNSESVRPAVGGVQIRGIGKAYRIYDHKWGRAAEWLGLGRRHHLHWVLRDIDLTVAPGEAIGIIGQNGAGKSTLLKLITGVARPTAGTVVASGHVSALLELGIGFHGDFSGRENAINTLRLSGVADSQIPALLPGIEAFADLGEYFEQPVRTYSSGMMVRLAFATVTAERPDILIVDEALAVGDVFFQQRCFDRIHDFRRGGTTLLFVSHAVASVYALCDRAVLLRDGRIARDGTPREVIDLYNADVAARGSDSKVRIRTASAGPGADAPASATGGTGSYESARVELDAIAITSGGAPAKAVEADAEMTLALSLRFCGAVDDPHVGFQVRDARGEVLYRTHTHGQGLTPDTVTAGDMLDVEFTFEARLAPGDYTVTVGVGYGARPGGVLAHPLLRLQDVAEFTVVRPAEAGHWDGRINLQPRTALRRRAAQVKTG